MRLWAVNLRVYLMRACMVAVVVFSGLFGPDAIISAQSVGRPRIGLALSGGGACGLAHIGVIKVMEEAGLQPDFITGVSMGSIVGGLYAIGYSGDSLHQICSVLDWDLILSNKLPEYKIIYPEKKHFYNSMVALPLTSGKPMLPIGLNNGQQLENVLSYYAWPAAGINDFSALPIPYMCLATDLVTCRKTELRNGYLPDALRASSAVPTIFTPIKIDSIPYIDGGALRNLAVSELRDMGADFVIGSYTGRHYNEKEEIETFTDVMTQLLFSVGIYDYHDQKQYADVIIEPKTEDFSSASFVNIDTIIDRGYRAALPFKPLFIKLADSLSHYGTKPPPESILGREAIIFDTVIISGNKRVSSQQILKVLKFKSGDPVDKDILRDRIDRLYGNAWFDKVKYSIAAANDSMILNIECEEAPRTIMYGSLHYDEVLHAGLIIGLTMRNPLIRRSMIDANSYIGHFHKVRADYIQFFDPGQRLGLALSLYAENTYIPSLELAGDAGGTYNRCFYQRVMLSQRIGRNISLGFSLTSEKRSLVPDYLSGSGLEGLYHHYLSGSLEFNANTLDHKYFPDKGLETHLSFTRAELLTSKMVCESNTVILKSDYYSEGGFDPFFVLHATLCQYHSAGRWTMGIRGTFLSVSESDSVSSQNNFFFLGGFEAVDERTIPMTGFHAFQLKVRKAAGFGMNLDCEIFDKAHLNLTADFFVTDDTGWPDDILYRWGIGLGAGYMSVVGPLRAGLMYGVNGDDMYFNRLKGYISLGFSF